MMHGSFFDDYPLLPVTFFLPNQPPFAVDCIIDTAFAGYLTLPIAAVRALGLRFFYKMPANLADDTDIMVEVYTAVILWHGQRRDVEVLAMGKRPLLGRSLLRGNEASIQFIDGGAVSINALDA